MSELLMVIAVLGGAVVVGAMVVFVPTSSFMGFFLTYLWTNPEILKMAFTNSEHTIATDAGLWLTLLSIILGMGAAWMDIMRILSHRWDVWNE